MIEQLKISSSTLCSILLDITLDFSRTISSHFKETEISEFPFISLLTEFAKITECLNEFKITFDSLLQIFYEFSDNPIIYKNVFRSLYSLIQLFFTDDDNIFISFENIFEIIAKIFNTNPDLLFSLIGFQKVLPSLLVLHDFEFQMTELAKNFFSSEYNVDFSKLLFQSLSNPKIFNSQESICFKLIKIYFKMCSIKFPNSLEDFISINPIPILLQNLNEVNALWIYPLITKFNLTGIEIWKHNSEKFQEFQFFWKQQTIDYEKIKKIKNKFRNQFVVSFKKN